MDLEANVQHSAAKPRRYGSGDDVSKDDQKISEIDVGPDNRSEYSSVVWNTDRFVDG